MTISNINDPRRKSPWYKNSWHCDICNVSIRINHKSVHLKSKGHLGRAGRAYEYMPSDVAFAEFLHGVGPWDLYGDEWDIYIKALRRNDNGNTVLQQIEQGNLPHRA